MVAKRPSAPSKQKPAPAVPPPAADRGQVLGPGVMKRVRRPEAPAVAAAPQETDDTPSIQVYRRQR